MLSGLILLMMPYIREGTISQQHKTVVIVKHEEELSLNKTVSQHG